MPETMLTAMMVRHTRILIGNQLLKRGNMLAMLG